MNHAQNQNNENTLTTIISAASNTPFKTAFKITLGVALGNLTVFLMGIGALGISVLFGTLIYTWLKQ